MDDFFEIMDFCAFDLDRASALVEEYIRSEGGQNVEALQPEPAGA